MITSATPLFSIVAQPYLGSLADKVKSPRKVAMMALTIAIIFDVIFMMTHNFFILLISSGLVLSLYNSVTPLTDRIGVSAPYDFGKIRLWGSVGFAIAAQVCGIIYDVIAPMSVFILFILGTIVTIYCIFMVKDPHVTTAKHDNYKASDAYKSLFHNKKFILFIIITIFFWGANMTNMTYLPVFFRSLGGSATQVGTYQLCATLFEIPMILATDKIIKHFSYKAIMIFTCLVSIINFVWYAMLPSPSLIICVFVFKGFSTVLFTMITVRLIIDIVDERYVSTAFGLQSMAGRGFGAVIVQMISGSIIDSFNMSVYYIFLTILIVVALCASVFYQGNKR